MIGDHREDICIQMQSFLAKLFRPPGPVAVTESVFPEIENITGIDNVISLHQHNVVCNSEAHL